MNEKPDNIIPLDKKISDKSIESDRTLHDLLRELREKFEKAKIILEAKSNEEHEDGAPAIKAHEEFTEMNQRNQEQIEIVQSTLSNATATRQDVEDALRHADILLDNLDGWVK